MLAVEQCRFTLLENYLFPSSQTACDTEGDGERSRLTLFFCKGVTNQGQISLEKRQRNSCPPCRDIAALHNHFGIKMRRTTKRR